MDDLDALKARVVELEKAQANTVAAHANLMNRELALRAAVTALIYRFPKHALTEDFNMFLDQIAATVKTEFQRPEEWDKIRTVVDDDRPGERA